MQSDIVPRQEAVKNRNIAEPPVLQDDASQSIDDVTPPAPKPVAVESQAQEPPAPDENPAEPVEPQTQPADETLQKNHNNKTTAVVVVAVIVFLGLAAAAIYREVNYDKPEKPRSPYQTTSNLNN